MRAFALARSGITLVELLVAIFMATLLIGAIAGTSIQVQETINTTLQRELAAQQARSLFRDIETDLSRMIPCAQAPAPFANSVRNGGSPQRPIEIERVDPTSIPANADPAPLPEPRRADRMRVFTSFDGTQAAQQQVAEYLLDQQGGTSGGTPNFQMPPGNGYWSGRLRRQVWKCQPPEPGKSYPDPGPICVDNVVSFQLDWTDPKADATIPGFQPPTAQTSTGDEFVRAGTFAISEFVLNASDQGAQKLLGALPIGGQVWLVDPTAPVTDPGFGILIRHKNGSGSNIPSALVNDRIDPKTGLKGSALLPPSLIRVTLVLAWGKGQKAETGRFVRSFRVPN
ncbi:MAG: type II secretion system protein J [Planctomycetota bacterium]